VTLAVESLSATADLSIRIYSEMGCFSSKPRTQPAPTLESIPSTEGRRNSEFRFKPGQFIQHFQFSFLQRYKVVRELGSGSFGKVYEAEHRQTHQRRAVKELEKSAAEKETHAKFISEVEILSRLDHPHILKLYELYEDANKYYVVSEILTGGELFDYIIKVGHLSEASAAKIMYQVLSAVVYCHSNGVVHRDLKPENLVLESAPDAGRDLCIKLIDFGTSSLFAPSQRLHLKIGTPYYIAPEVLSMDYNEKCDVWSCGVILYVLLSGRSPFPGRSNDEILRKVKKGEFSFAHQEFDRVSLEAKSFIRSLLTMSVQDRPTSAAALASNWIAKHRETGKEHTPALSLGSLDQLRRFRAEEKLKQAALAFIMGQLMSQEQTRQLREEFQALDTNGDGKISKEELIHGYEKKKFSHEEAMEIVEEVMRKVDADGSGFIDYTEFLTASSNVKNLLSRSNIESVFRAFDKDGSGKITIAELKEMLSAQQRIPEQAWKALLREADKNQDGEIDLKEFINLMG